MLGLNMKFCCNNLTINANELHMSRMTILESMMQQGKMKGPCDNTSYSYWNHFKQYPFALNKNILPQHG